MSDDYEYTPRGDEEFRALEERFRNSAGSKNYVAKAAPGFDTHGFWHCFDAGSRSGYAAHATALHWMLDNAIGIPTQLVPHRNLDIDIERFPEDRYDTLFAWHKNAVGIPHALFCSFPPEIAVELDGLGPPLVPYCAYEGDRVSAICRDMCNGDAFASVWVVSDFVRRAMLNGGVAPSRVHVVRPPLCDGPWTMTPMETLRERVGRPVTSDDPFTFGVMGTWHERKGMHALVRAYFGAFKRDEPVKLTIRTSVFGSHKTIKEFMAIVTEEIAAIALEFGDSDFPASKKMPRLQILVGTAITDQEVIEWLGGLDCYANPSFGEGLGIPHHWAKANGVPMVSTAYGAVGDMLVDIEADPNAGTRGLLDTIVSHQLTSVSPDMWRVGLMFEPGVKWGTYSTMEFGVALRLQYITGRRLDEGAAAVIRSAFSLDACVEETLRPALIATLGSDEWSSWKMKDARP